MILIIKKNANNKEFEDLKSWVYSLGFQIHLSEGENTTIMGLVGDTSLIDVDQLNSLSIVAAVKRIQEPFKKANRKFHPQDTVIELSNTKIGGGTLSMIAGPCSVESEEQIIEVAEAVKKAGATLLRGGTFKPRTSPYAFQGLKADGIDLLVKAKKATGLPIVSEIMNINHLDLFSDVDVIQVGARNMQNFELLKELGRTNKAILLKRGLSSTIEELLMSAEYIMSEGNDNVILCERGIRTFETYTRNTLDLASIPLLKELSHLPVIVDPSHATGIAKLVPPMALAAAAAGADGLMIEVHNNPSKALCDGAQSLTPIQFADIMTKLKQIEKIR